MINNDNNSIRGRIIKHNACDIVQSDFALDICIEIQWLVHVTFTSMTGSLIEIKLV